MNQNWKFWVILLVSLASSLLPAATADEAVNASSLEVNWDLVEDYDYRSAAVGDTVEFFWNGTQTIYIQTTDDGCNASRAIELVSDSSSPPATYTFTDEDMYTEIVFSRTLQNDCFVNDTVIFSVNPSTEDRPTDCKDRSDALEECMEEAGARVGAIVACEACITSSVAGNTVFLGSGCLEYPERACQGFVDCDCRGCYFEAAAWGSCEMDKTREENCTITDCSEEVGLASVAFSIDSVFHLFGGALVSFLVSI